jgi:hypothetical protein
VARASTGDRLAEQRYVTVIVRLLVDTRGRLVRGEIVDTDGKIADRFTRWRALTPALRTLIMSHKQDGDGE